MGARYPSLDSVTLEEIFKKLASLDGAELLKHIDWDAFLDEARSQILSVKRMPCKKG